MSEKKCDTIGCMVVATHRLSWVDDFGQTVDESVCEPCGQGYASRPCLKATLTPLEAPASVSGYIPCACRDCMDIAITDDNKPALCLLCKDAGCEISYGKYMGDSGAHSAECQREDAYMEAGA